jgi:hypothetical protein
MRSILIFSVFLASLPATGQVVISQQHDKISIQIDHQPEIDFFYGPEVTKPYLYPLRAASGAIVTRQWPMNPQAGERHDHIHHRGVWFAHSNVNGVDFWNSDPSYHNARMGHIVVTKIDRLDSGKQSGSITADLDWQDPSNKTLLQEHRVMTFYAGNPRIIDFDFELTAREPVTFGDDKDGVFGMRLAPELEEPAKDAPAEPLRSGVMTSAKGCHQEAECWGKRADWIDMSGSIGGQQLGVALFDYPDNPGYPTYWHVRGYGLLASNIFGVKAFTKDPSADGSLTLAAGKKLRFRYRLVVHAGDAAAAKLPLLYSSYVKTGSSSGLR